jgi:O-acetyl-ADP-ribose deacetylase (regulator of RNase III)
MIIEKSANLLEEPLDGIIQQCNCFCVQSAGIALRIKNKFPEAYEADCKTVKGDESKLGHFSVAILPNNFHIYNMYGQLSFGGGRQTNYEAVANGLGRIEWHASSSGLRTIGLPARMGCVLGGGDYRIVRAIIETVFADSPLQLFICDYQG